MISKKERLWKQHLKEQRHGATPTWAFRTPEGEGRLSKISQMFLASHAW